MIAKLKMNKINVVISNSISCSIHYFFEYLSLFYLFYWQLNALDLVVLFWVRFWNAVLSLLLLQQSLQVLFQANWNVETVIVKVA